MKLNPWTSAAIGLLKGKPQVVDLAVQMASLDECLRDLIALPPTTPAKGRRTAATRLAALYGEMDWLTKTIREEHGQLLLRSIANAHGPVGPLDWPSGLLGYVDVAEHALGGLGVIHDEGTPGPPGRRALATRLNIPPVWSQDRYSAAVAWITTTISTLLLDELAGTALQDLARLRFGVVLTPEEVRQRRERRAARSRVFHHDLRLKKAPAIVLGALAQLKNDPVVTAVDGFASTELVVAHLPFKRRTFMDVQGDLQTCGLVAKGPRGGFRITTSGITILRLQSERH